MRILRVLASVVFTATLAVSVLGGAWPVSRTEAASAYANPAFQAQWQQGEMVTPNFWGPLQLAHDGQNEPYVEAPGGTRVVQYFDKARMELTNPANGMVTNGLLATELITGKVQVGDSAFQNLAPSTVPVAGDGNNIGPTYAQIGASGLTGAAASAIGQPTTRALSGMGALGMYAAGGSDANATIAAYDDTTKHNVPKGFADYRAKAGLLTIGLAIAEPFWANGVLVGGQPKDVLVQAFERRVLTYTPSNPDAFKVEFGNIGAHYFTWRYGGGSGSMTGGSVAAPTAVATATSAASPTAPPATQQGTVMVSPSSIPLGDGGAKMITISGKLQPNQPYMIFIINQGNSREGSASGTTAADGSFSVMTSITVGTAGTRMVQVTQGTSATVLAMTTLVITAGGGGTMSAPAVMPAAMGGSVNVSPNPFSLAALTSTVFTFSGSLMPSHLYDISIVAPGATTSRLVTSPMTDADGNFNVSVPPSAVSPLVPGTYVVEVHPASEATVVATGMFVVTP